MAMQTFVNLPVLDLAKATEFFGGLGFSFDEMVGGPDLAVMIVSDNARVMLHKTDSFRQYAGGAVANTTLGREVIVGLSAESREQVDDLADRAVAAGAEDLGGVEQGFMYMRGFRDLDGHQWSFLHMAFSGQ